jgi:hypothetical protein
MLRLKRKEGPIFWLVVNNTNLAHFSETGVIIETGNVARN